MDEEPIGLFKEYILGVIDHTISRELFLEESTRVLDDPSINDPVE